MTDDATTGVGLSRAFFDHIVQPIMAARSPGVPYSAGRLGGGSDVLGLDDATSRDHDWGLRLSLFVPEGAVHEVDDALERRLPDRFRGLPTRFAFTGERVERHHIEVSTVSSFVEARLGFDPRAGVTVRDWLSLSGQAALEVVAGPVFVDHGDELGSVRRALEWYPDDVWRYALACDWIRIDQELPLLGRTADVGDDTGSRIIAARLAQVVMHVAFLLERRWPPYSKWFGSRFRALQCSAEVTAAVATMLRADDAPGRHRGIQAALEHLLGLQNALGLTDVDSATLPFWDRPHLQPNPEVIKQLVDGIEDPEVRALPRGRGTIEQRTDNVDVLVDARARRRATAD